MLHQVFLSLSLSLGCGRLISFFSSLDVQLQISNFDYFDGVALPHTFGDSSSSDAPAGSDQGPACKGPLLVLDNQLGAIVCVLVLVLSGTPERSVRSDVVW